MYNLEGPQKIHGTPMQGGNTPTLQSGKFLKGGLNYHSLGTFNLCAKKPDERSMKKGISIVEYGDSMAELIPQ